MVKFIHAVFCLSIGLLLSACLGNTSSSESAEAQHRHEIYLQKLSDFAKTRNVEAICAAASIAGNREQPFPMTHSARSETFVALSLIGISESEVQGLTQGQTNCASGLYEALYIGRPARLKVSRPMTDCLDAAMVDEIFTANDYRACAKTLDYTPY